MNVELKDALAGVSDGVKALRESYDEKFGGLAERIERIEAQGDRPGKVDSKEFSKEQNEYKAEFLSWMRKPSDRVRENRLSEASHEFGKKDVTIGTGSAGGYALPEEISRQIENRERQLNPFRQLVRVEQCSTNDYKALVSMGDGTTGWVSETGSRSATNSPTLRERAPTFGEQYAYPTASEWSLDDVFFNVQKWIVDEVAADWASAEATAIISGTGSSQPTGILNSTPTATNDDGSPMRAASTIEYVGLSSASSPTALNLDSLITLVGSVKERYLQETDGCAFVMHRLTAAYLRRQKASSSGTYLWEENAQLGQPASLLGYRLVTCDAMPQLGNDNFAVLFGNFKRGFLLVDRVGIRVTPNPYSTPGQVSFYVRRRVGGTVLNNDAIKALRISD